MILIKTTLWEQICHKKRASKKLFEKIIVPLVDNQYEEIQSLKAQLADTERRFRQRDSWCVSNNAKIKNLQEKLQSATEVIDSQNNEIYHLYYQSAGEWIHKSKDRDGIVYRVWSQAREWLKETMEKLND